LHLSRENPILIERKGYSMNKERCAVFSCMGLGDGLITLTLSNNLFRQGHEVVTYHPFLEGMQDWFPDLPLKRFPSTEEMEQSLASYDKYFILFEKSPWMSHIINYCKTHYPDKTTIINPIATPKTNYPYWENAKFDGTQPFAGNLAIFCKQILHCKNPTKDNGIRPLSIYTERKYPCRVILHPTSSRPGKNWTQDKFLTLASRLQKKGFEPCFILSKEERTEWSASTPLAPEFSNLSELAGFVFESGYMIGNDSGIGHLASSLGLPTLTICRSRMTSRFWRPSWSRGSVVCPPSWIPNIKGFRCRDKHWKKFVPVWTVERAFSKLIQGD